MLTSSQIHVRGKYCLFGFTIFSCDGPGILFEPRDGKVGTGLRVVFGVGPVGIGVVPGGGRNGIILLFGRIGLNLLLFLGESKVLCAC